MPRQLTTTDPDELTLLALRELAQRRGLTEATELLRIALGEPRPPLPRKATLPEPGAWDELGARVNFGA